MTRTLNQAESIVNSPRTMADAALAYAKRGIRVFATTSDGKAPSTSNAQWSKRLGKEVKKGQGGLHMATTDEETIRWMFSFSNAGGIGMPCGQVNNVIVSDFDTHKTGKEGENARRVFDSFRDEIGQAQTVRTRNGGWHVYWAYAPGHGKFELGEGIEVQSDGAYVLLPPSKGYVWGKRIDRDEWEAPPWPAVPNRRASAEDIQRRELSAETPPEVLELFRRIKANDGRWHDSVVKLTAHLWGSGWSDAEILRHAVNWTASGYTHAETFEEIATAIAGARAKWDSERALQDRSANAVDAIRKNLRKLTKKQLGNLHTTIGKMIDND